MATIGSRLGQLEFLKAKGDPVVDIARRWLLIAMGASATGKFVFALGDRWNLALLVLVPVLGELAAVLLGLLMRRAGVIESHYRLAYDLDPARRLPVERLDGIGADLARLREAVDRLLLVVERLDRRASDHG